MDGFACEDERRLLLGTFGGKLAEKTGTCAFLDNILNGEYGELFQDESFKALLPNIGDSPPALSSIFQHLRHKIHEKMCGMLKSDDLEGIFQMLAFGVASFLAFYQSNITGPVCDIPESPFGFDSTPIQSTTGSTTVSHDSQWATTELSVDGEDIFAKISHPQYLLLARTILLTPLHLKFLQTAPLEKLSQTESPGLATDIGDDVTDQGGTISGSTTVQIGDYSVEIEEVDADDLPPVEFLNLLKKKMPSWCWWAGRCVGVHQDMLSHRSATLRVELMALIDHLMEIWGEMGGWVNACGLIECGLWELKYGRVDCAKKLIKKSSEEIGVNVEVTGAMGIRTVHQQTEKAQLSLKVERKGQVSAPPELHGESTETLGLNFDKEEVASSDLNGLGDSDIFLRPKFSENNSKIGEIKLNAVEQCVVLAQVALIDKGTGNDELKTWEMAPYIEGLECQENSHFIIQASAALYRAQHERNRPRTRERSLLQMEHLVERIKNAKNEEKIQNRLMFAFAVSFPPIAALRKMYCEQLVSLGLVGPAIQTYEELEMWDNLLFCYRLLKKDAQAEALVQNRLKIDPNNPRLLCALGDLKGDDGCYRMAWFRSNHKYARAQRSLATSALRKKNYEAASKAFSLALKISPLHPNAWFSLGYCYMKIEDSTAALQAFTRCAQLEPENGEAWNNLAAIWLQLGKSSRAFWALKEALKYRTNSWEAWENYAQAAVDSGEYSQCTRALLQILQLTEGQRIKVEIVAKLIKKHAENTPKIAEKNEVAQSDMHWHKNLQEFLKKGCLAPGWNSELWRFYGKFQENEKNWAMARECFMKASRQLQGSEWRKDTEKFEKLAAALQDLVSNYVISSEVSEGPSVAEVSSVRLTLRGILKQAKMEHEDSDTYGKLAELMGQIEGLEEKLRAT